eukprot:1966249-Karenia_brevis.AAC.1
MQHTAPQFMLDEPPVPKGEFAVAAPLLVVGEGVIGIFHDEECYPMCSTGAFDGQSLKAL